MVEKDRAVLLGKAQLLKAHLATVGLKTQRIALMLDSYLVAHVNSINPLVSVLDQNVAMSQKATGVGND
jgi:hypothetical protein